MVLLLIATLVLSPLLNFSVAYAVMQDSPEQNLSVSTTTSKCHKISVSTACIHCETISSNQCQHESDDNCDNSCGHGAVTAAISSQIFDVPLYDQANPALYRRLTTSIVLDTVLQPPQIL